VRQTEYTNALTKTYGEKATALRKEYERIANEIQYNYKHKMKLLRENMEYKRKEAIEKIERKKNQAIQKLVDDHERKYKEIKEYYSEITGINMDLIQSLKIELNEVRAQDIKMQKEKMRQHERNQEVEGPLLEASAEVERLQKVEEKHKVVKEALKAHQQEIAEMTATFKREEWEYEVKLQQFQYLKTERDKVFDTFNKTVYEIH
jgi:chromosome segregation ATPase